MVVAILFQNRLERHTVRRLEAVILLCMSVAFTGLLVMFILGLVILLLISVLHKIQPERGI
jgi:hypothetical protein